MGPLYTFIGPQKSDLKNPENLDLRMGASNSQGLYRVIWSPRNQLFWQSYEAKHAPQ